MKGTELSATRARISAVDTYDIRFPTSRELDGSDAMNPDPDYSAAYLILRTSAGGQEGHGFTFTIGRGNDVQVAAINTLRPYIIGRSVAELCADPGFLYRDLIGDSQLRWLGPEKGVMHMAIGAVVNAVWDLAAKREERRCGSCSPTPTPNGWSPRSTSATSPTHSLLPRPSTCSGGARTGPIPAPGTWPSAATPPTPPRLAGWATATRSSPASPSRPWPTASPRSS